MRNIEDYLISLKEKLAGGVATEHTYRFALQRLLEARENCDLKKVTLATAFIKKGRIATISIIITDEKKDESNRL